MEEHVRNKYTLAAVALAVIPFLAFLRSSAVTCQAGSVGLKLSELNTSSSWPLTCADHELLFFRCRVMCAPAVGFWSEYFNLF